VTQLTSEVSLNSGSGGSKTKINTWGVSTSVTASNPIRVDSLPSIVYLVFVPELRPADNALNVKGGSGGGTGVSIREGREGGGEVDENSGPNNSTNILQGIPLQTFLISSLRTSFAIESAEAALLVDLYKFPMNCWTRDFINVFVEQALLRWSNNLRKQSDETTRNWTARVVTFLSLKDGYSKTIRNALGVVGKQSKRPRDDDNRHDGSKKRKEKK
jgi:hypothetical protein